MLKQRDGINVIMGDCMNNVVILDTMQVKYRYTAHCQKQEYIPDSVLKACQVILPCG